MKSESQVRQKIKQVVFRHRKKYVENGLKRWPSNCAHNKLVRLRTPSSGKHQIRCCSLKNDDVDQTDLVCDRNLGGLRQSRSCPYFEHRASAQDLKQEFVKKLGLDGSPVSLGELARDYPDVVALNWVLGAHKEAKEGPADKPGETNHLLILMSEEDLETPDE